MAHRNSGLISIKIVIFLNMGLIRLGIDPRMGILINTQSIRMEISSFITGPKMGIGY